MPKNRPNYYIRTPTFHLQTVHLLTTRLQQLVSTTIRLHYYLSPLQFVSTTIRLHYYLSPILFVSTTIRLHTIRLLTICIQQFVSTTIRLHYFSSPDNSSPYDSSPLLFVSITIRLHYFSIYLISHFLDE